MQSRDMYICIGYVHVYLHMYRDMFIYTELHGICICRGICMITTEGWPRAACMRPQAAAAASWRGRWR